MYILSFNAAPAISDLAVGIGVPVVQFDSVDVGEEKANWEIGDGKMVTTNSNKTTVEVSFKPYSDNQTKLRASLKILCTLYKEVNNDAWTCQC